MHTFTGYAQQGAGTQPPGVGVASGQYGGSNQYAAQDNTAGQYQMCEYTPAVFHHCHC